MSCIVPYDEDCEFPIENLPYGVFSTQHDPTHRIGVAIGDKVLDIKGISHMFTGPELSGKQHVFKSTTLNNFMSLRPSAWNEARETLHNLLTGKDTRISSNPELMREVLVPQSQVEMHLPAAIGDYTDFYSSINHAKNVGTMFRGPENCLMPNWRYLPVAYHGRASSVVVSGTPIRRPHGQICLAEGDGPIFGPSRLMDFELELAFFIGGPPTDLGNPVPISKAQEYIFGFVLMNDWSARDIQKWEYQPLGPFSSKNLGTTISPWIISIDALKPFIVENTKQEPPVLPYLQHSDNFNFNINFQVFLTPEGSVPQKIASMNYRDQYWTAKQQLAHHTITGCNIKPGDLMGSGTISGNVENSYGSMLELSWRGTKPLLLQDGKQRKFLEDGDEISLVGVCQGSGYKIGFGPCKGKLLPSLPLNIN